MFYSHANYEWNEILICVSEPLNHNRLLIYNGSWNSYKLRRPLLTSQYVRCKFTILYYVDRISYTDVPLYTQTEGTQNVMNYTNHKVNTSIWRVQLTYLLENLLLKLGNTRTVIIDGLIENAVRIIGNNGMTIQ